MSSDCSSCKSNKKGCLIFLLVGFVGFVVFVTGIFFVIGSTISGASEMMTHEWSGVKNNNFEENLIQDNDAKNKVLVIEVHGVITSMNGHSDDIVKQLKIASQDKKVKAIILSLNTPGGEVIATDEIHHEIQKIREMGIPVISQMRSMAASGGYYLAAGTDYIVANRLTLTGSIGVIMSSYNMHGLFEKIGVKAEVFKSGSMKDTLSLSADPNTAERASQNALLEKMVAESFEEFALIVAHGRNMPIDKVKADGIGDARIMSGKEARDKGLVDELGYFEEALREAIKRSGEKDLNVVSYKKHMTFSDIFMQLKTPASAQLVKEGFERGFLLSPGKVYYLAPGTY